MVYEELIFKQKIEYSVNTIYIFKYVNITIIKELNQNLYEYSYEINISLLIRSMQY